MNKKILISLLVVGVILIGISYFLVTQEEREGGLGLANPAAVYCEELGYQYKIITTENGGQIGICQLPGGIECNGWDFFTGECGQEYTYCAQHGGTVTTKTEYCRFAPKCIVCILPDGTECDEWDYFKGECP
jgi:putative hemolysin